MSDASSESRVVVLCPGQGAQAVGMGRAWAEKSPAAKKVFDDADAILGEDFQERFGTTLSRLCFEGPDETLQRTDVSQPAIYTCSVASWHGLREQGASWEIEATAGLSLGEYTALHLAGVFDFETGLKIVSLRGRLMQEAAEESEGGMVALIGADEAQAKEVCDRAAGDWVLVPANYNAPGQIVLSGQDDACRRAVEVASAMGLRATPLKVAGAFHSPLMKPAADRLYDALHEVEMAIPPASERGIEVWSNVTAEPHDLSNRELLRRRLVEQLVEPVRWSSLCQGLAARYTMSEYHELAPGSVLRGLMRRIDRNTKVVSHDEP